MNTPAHLLIGSAAFAHPTKPGTYRAALFGAILPDLSLYLMVAYCMWVLDVPASTIFREYYYSDSWQAVFAVDNSFVLWGAVFAVAYWREMPRLLAFAGGGLLHLSLDFPLHTHDARQHFWPLSDWVFESPVSYWDGRAYGDIVGPVEFALCIIASVWLFRRFKSWAVRLSTAILLLFEAVSSGFWRLIF